MRTAQAEQRIAHLRIPWFGAAVVRQVDPRLAEHPLVLFDEHGRVIDVDRKAASAGVTRGVPEREAIARCPEGILVPAARYPVFEAYEAFLERVRAHTDRWQPDGLGCVYLDATHAGMDLLRWTQAVAAAVRKLGWEPAVGATGSKFGAQVAGRAAWQNAALLLAPGVQRSFLAGQPVVTLPLDNDALTQIRHLGIRTLGQYAQLPASGVLVRFGTAGRTAQRWALGLDDRRVVPPWEAPETSARMAFETPLADRDRLLAALVRSTERLLVPLQDRLQAVERVVLLVTRGDGRSVQVTHIFPLPTAALTPMRLALDGLLTRVSWEGEGASELTLTLAGITDAPAQQLTLFDAAGDDERSRLVATLERLAARYGADAFRLSALTDPDNPLPERRASWRGWG